MLFLGLALIAVAIWNFIVGVWGMGIVALLLGLWVIGEIFSDDDDYYYSY
jgi:hypothetical protein